MRILLALVGLLVSALAESAERLVAFGHEIEYAVPSSAWIESDRISSISKGMVMYKHTPLKDKEGRIVEPVLSIIYELTPTTITSLDEYVSYARAKTPFTTVSAKKLENGTVVFFCTYTKHDVSHSLEIGHLFSDGVGVQVMSDTTVSLLSRVSADQRNFVSSVVLKAKATQPLEK